MSLEEEAKLRVSHREFLSLLDGAGIRYQVGQPLEQRDLFYDFPDGRLARADVALRIRVEPGRTLITYKGPRVYSGGVKTRLELEGEPGFPEALEALRAVGIQPECGDVEKSLRLAGLIPIVEVRKVRTPLLLEGSDLHIYLDRVEGLGEFVEVEGPKEKVREFIVKLNLVDRSVRETYAEMLIRRPR